MAKRIIVLSDGTGNSAAQVWRTNVWRTFEAIDLTGSDQVAFYDDGVGTSSFKPLAILGGVFGYGLKRNVLELYKFLCRNYKSGADYGPDEPGDAIYGFGFSRGAFTIRVLTGLVLDQGLAKASTEAELDDLALEAYRNYRTRHFKTKTGIERPFRLLRDFLLRRKPTGTISEARLSPTIAFLGLWDTVAAYGLPVDEMTRGVSRYLWPLELPNRQIDPKIERACHALSLDDQRTTFHPVLWDESHLAQSKAPPPALTSEQKVTQVWFAGVHSNIGGGYPDDSLAYIPMYWIWKEAQNARLVFKKSPTSDPDAFLNARSKEDKDGRLYDSRSGLGGYYRYGPRSVEALSKSISNDPRDCVSITRPKIHESVFRRISVGAHSYAPVSLPSHYDIVCYDEISKTHKIIVGPNELPEKPAAASRRYLDQDKIVWSTVWRVRGLYFLTVLASLYLAIYPLAMTIPMAGEFSTRLRFLSDLIRLIAIPLPNAANRWVDAYARDPAAFLIAALTVGILIWLSSALRSKITDQMRNLLATSVNKPNNLKYTAGIADDWRPSGGPEYTVIALTIAAAIFGFLFNFTPIELAWLWEPLLILLKKISVVSWFCAVVTLIVLFTPATVIHSLRSAPKYQEILLALRLRIAPLAFAVVFCMVGFVFLNHYLFNIEDSSGAFCKSTVVSDKKLSAGTGGIKNVCEDSNRRKCALDDTSVTGTEAVCIKNKECTGKAVLVDTRSLCSPTGIFLQSNERYQLFVDQATDTEIATLKKNDSEIPSEWRLLGAASDPGGRTVSDLGKINLEACGPSKDLSSAIGIGANYVCTHAISLGRQSFAVMLYILKRTFDRPLGRFVLRYGETGNEENFIDADNPPQPNGRLDETFKPTRAGELFVYINKPTLGIWPNAFLNINSGIAKIHVIRIPPKS